MNEPTALDPSTRERLVRALRRQTPDAALHAVLQRVAAALRTDLALVTLLGSDDWVAEATAGELAPELAAGLPASWAFCRAVVESGKPVVVPDATADAAFRDTPLVRVNLVRSYAGAPVVVPGIGAVGAVCAAGGEPRAFDAGDLGVLEMAAEVVSAELARRLPPEAPPSPRSPSGPRPGQPLLGQTLADRWLVLGALGSGGQSTVYAAREIGSGVRVAVKLGRFGARHSAVDEARDLVRVRHPSLVHVHAAGELPDGRSWLVMDHVEGQPLLDLARSPDRASARRVVRDVAGALTALHGVGLLHGDVKPQNVLLDRAADRAVLIDLGLGLRAGRPGSGGTPGWSAPEQLRADAPQVLTPAVDTYALAALAWFATTGRGPFSDLPPGQRRLAQARAAPDPVPELGPAAEVLVRALAPDPADRPATPLELAVALDAALARAGALPEGEPRSAAANLRAAVAEARAIEPGVEARVRAGLPEDLRAELAAVDEASGVRAEAFVAWLRAYGDGEALHALARRVAVRVGRTMASGLRLTFDPATLAQGLPGALALAHPWLAATVEVHGAMARLELAVPEPWRDVFEPWLVGVFTTVFARAGFLLESAWRPLDAERVELLLSWSDADPR